MNRELSYDLAIPFLGRHSKELKAGTPTGIRTPVFIAALFTIAKSQRQPRRPLMGEWVDKMWYRHTKVDCYSAVKRQEILTPAATWINFGDIMLCEMS